MVDADVVLTDGTHPVTLNVEQISVDIKRMPKVFTLKSLPSLGAPNSVATDFGAYAKMIILSGYLTSRANAKTLLDYVHDEWYTTGTNLSLTIPALEGKEDDAYVVIPSGSGSSPIVTRCHVYHDLEQTGPQELRFEIRIIVCKKL